MRSVTRITILLTLGIMGDAKSTQPDAMESAEEEAVHLPCNHSTIIVSEYIYWYRQLPHQGPEYVIHGLKDNVTKEMASLIITTDRKSSTLILPHVTVKDSAVYYCILSDDGGYKWTFGSGTRLLVRPVISDPDPSVYQMRSPESNNVSVCLFTDFDSETIVPQDEESTVHGTNSTSLHMKSMGSKSNGALRWSTSPDFSCGDTFKETFYSSSDFPCDATLVEKSFETDMNLNLQNLSVIGFRILLLKVAGFNLLMTLRLWSS